MAKFRAFLLCLRGVSTPFLLEFFVRHLMILLTWLSLGHDSNTMLDEHKLSTLNLSSHDFALGFLKRPHTNRDSIL